MKKFFRAVAVAALAATALPTVGRAQQNIEIRVENPATDWLINAGPGGGQFKIQTQNPSLGDLIAYCIDPTRTAPWVTFRQYKMYTFAEYVAATLPGNFVPSQSMDDLTTMAVNAMTIATNGVSPISNAAQYDTWNIFRGINIFNQQPANGSPQTGDFSAWRVLVSVDALNGQGAPQVGYQTFITTVPEPSTYVLMAVGMAGMLVVARRRRNA